MNDLPRVIVFQLGAREHYALAEGFMKQGKLAYLVTDYWYGGNLLIARLFRKAGLGSLLLRKNDKLKQADAPVHSFNLPLILFELMAGLYKKKGWALIFDRNRWFAKRAAAWLDNYLSETTERPVIFSYSYTALEVFEVAKKYGCPTWLGQIDGGRAEERIVQEETIRYKSYGEHFTGIPEKYWAYWEREIALSDSIIVNSAWSAGLSLKNGLPLSKLSTIPLAYAPPDIIQKEIGVIQKGSLKVLYLGTLTLRKGLARLLEAAELLEQQYPEIIFTIAGGGALHIPEKFRNLSNVKFVGKVERNEVGAYYRKHDVFLFPTISDGFGLTQLEALANGCFLLASQNCADIIQNDNELGAHLVENTPTEIAKKLVALAESGITPPSSDRIIHKMKAYSLDRIMTLYRNL